MKKAKVEVTEEGQEALQGQYDKLEAIQGEIEKLNDEATEEILQIEKKYNGLRKPFYKHRNDVIREIPGFWLKAFLNHEMLCDLLDPEDQKVFQHAKDLSVEDFDDVKSGFKITFTFDSNPYFKNKTLHKEFKYNPDGQLTVIPSKIEWKEGMDLTKMHKAAAPKTETGKRSRDSSETESFFNWFNAEDQDLELGEIIKEDLWPNPAKYYHGLQGSDDDEDLYADEDGEDDLPEEDELGDEEEGEEDNDNEDDQ